MHIGILLGIIIMCIGVAVFVYTLISGNIDISASVGVMLVVCLIGFIISIVSYCAYVQPQVNLDAHNYCISQGYDTFETWEGKGFFPETPLYIKCKFVDNRNDIQGTLALTNGG